MFEKTFISLFFTPNRLQVLKLSGDKKQVEKFTSVDLPKGLITNFWVQDKKSLAGLLKNLWQRLKIEEKSVGIIIPEFSTFTKSLLLPHLETQDLDEAVRWQAQEFLPLKSEKMVMDWKIVQRQGKNYQILLAAIAKDLLLSFIDSVAEAGLFPLVVETPSLSLVRISDGQPSGKLVVYANFGETILILAQEDKILNSSVISSDDTNGILWTAKSMVKHYKKFKVERISIGGLGLNKELLSSLESQLRLPISWIKLDIKGLSAEQIQEYLVPISLQLKDPAEPLDETTINLLPAKWVKFYQNKKLKIQAWGLSLVSSFFIWVFFLISLGIYLIFSSRIKALERQNVVQGAELPATLSSQIQEINQLSNKVIKITGMVEPPQVVINALTQARPAGVRFIEEVIDLDNGKILLRGQAVNRQVLIQFKQKLEENKDFSKIDIPISTFEKEQNLEFEMTLRYKASGSKEPIKIPI